MNETELLKRKIVRFLKKHGPTHAFFLAEKIGCPNNTRFYRRKVSKAVVELFEKGLIEIKNISSWGPEEILKVSTIDFKKPRKGGSNA